MSNVQPDVPTAIPALVPWLLRVACFLAAAASGAALLAKVYGVASLQFVTVAFFLPGCLLILGVCVWSARQARSNVHQDILAGAVGGLIGTIGYDLFRLPIHWAGYRVFAQHGIYGLWLVEADFSTRFTDLAGWTYHFSNGISFGVMYGLLMRRRHWGWAVGWAILLESIAIGSPFGRIFSLRGNYPLVAVAYAAHVAYGLPLGMVTQNWKQWRQWFGSVPRVVATMCGVLAGAGILGVVLSPERITHDRRAQANHFEVSGRSLKPTWSRVQRREPIGFANPLAERAVVTIKDWRTFEVPGGTEVLLSIPTPGIYQVFVETELRTQSCFIAVEPVEDLP